MHSKNICSLVVTLTAAALVCGLLAPMQAAGQATQGVVIVPVQTVPTPSLAPTVTPAAVVYAQPVYAQPAYAQSAAPRGRSGPNIGLIVSGSVMLGVGWIMNFIVGLGAGTDPFASHSQPEWSTFRGTSFIPIAGPWVQLAVKPNGFTDDMWGAWLIIDGLLQGAGTILLISGIATSGGDDAEASSDEGVHWAVAPMLGTDRAGLTVLGSF